MGRFDALLQPSKPTPKQNEHSVEIAKNPENLTTRDEESQKAKINTPPLLQTQLQKTNERTNEQKIKKPSERRIERHSFDIFSDQKMGLDELQLLLYRKHGKKPKIGSLVREAVDDLFKKYKNERTNE